MSIHSPIQLVARALKICVLPLYFLLTSQVNAQPSQKPLFLTGSAPPAVLLTMGRDHKLFYEAYNDASDVDGDGIIDTKFKPTTITYYGLFDSYKCYAYDSTNKYFVPSAFTADKKCSGQWSGDFLNYLTTTRIDAVRKVLYGGMRYIDSATETVLERAYIPQDAHSFGKEWRSLAAPVGSTSSAADYSIEANGYDITQYAPFTKPDVGKQIIFASVTALLSRSRTDLAQPPLLRVLANEPERMWGWLSKERPVAGSTLTKEAGGDKAVIPADYVVRVKVCVPGLLEQNCSGYPDGAPTVYKPNGVLHEYGEEGQMHFGLLTGSYDNNTAGGVLRKNVASFADEIELSTGQFKSSAQGIVYNLNKLRVYGFGNSYNYDCGWNTGDPTTSGQNCEDWGNPIGEMMYEGLRYFAGKTTPTSAYISAGSTKDSGIGLTRPAWKDPYKSANNSNGLPYCSKPVQMVISDIYASFDSDQLPGSAFGTFSGDLPGLNVSTIANTISAKEGISGNYFIGQSGTNFDKISSAKTVSGFGNIRGLAPDEPTRAGSYYSAAVAHYGKGTDLRTDLADQGWAQTVDTYSIALASPLPKIQIPIVTGSNTGSGASSFITIIPFAKSVSGAGISPAASAYQPTNQIVDFYVDRIVNQPGFPTDAGVNDGRPYGKFRINFEDVEQGADHDMDAIAIYEYSLLANGKVQINLTSEYAAGGIVQHMGYIINGTSADGTYLEIRDKDTCAACDVSYALDTPPAGYSPGLPLTASRTFSPGTGSAKFIPHDPLWYAAKFGGFPDKKDAATKKVIATGTAGNIEAGWETAPNSGEPSNYFLVTNAAKLRDQLRKAFSDIQSKTSSGTASANGSTVITLKSRSFRASYSSSDWTAEIQAKKLNLDNTTSPLWTSSDAVSFPAQASDRNILTMWNNAPVRFNLTGSDPLPLTAASAFNLNQLYPTLEANAALGWATKTPAQKEAIAFGALVNYVRGDRSLEKGTAVTGTLRARNKLLADIVNSNIVYATSSDFGYSSLEGTEGTSYNAWVNAKDSAAYHTIYVGANDGMLHAFNAETGRERFAFVPSSVFGKLHRYATPGLPHEYYVDGRLVISDAYRSGAWTTVVLGSTGAGGRSVFALDVGSPTGTASNILWEFKTPELGYPIGVPLIARTSGASGRWVAVFANGYYGTGKKAVLFVLDLFTGAELTRIELEGTSAANGLGSVGAEFVRGQVVSIAAGDLLGNLWKIDASAASPTSWQIANGGKAIIKVTDPSNSNKPQPITAPPTFASIPSGGTQIFFGTGKLVDDADRTNTDVQSVYDVWLKTDPGRTLTRSDLIHQTIVEESTATARALEARYVSSNAGTGHERGWVLDLVSPNASGPTGERVIAPLNYLYGYINFNTWYPPTADPCVPGNVGWTMTLSGSSGSVTDEAQFDINGDRSYNASDKKNGRYAAGLQTNPGTSEVGYNLTPGTDVNQSARGSQLQTGSGATGCPSGQELVGSTCKPIRLADSCPACSLVIQGSLECRPMKCSAQSWVQLQ
jgi:type IV pilus assembly protein PilY1